MDERPSVAWTSDHTVSYIYLADHKLDTAAVTISSMTYTTTYTLQQRRPAHATHGPRASTYIGYAYDKDWPQIHRKYGSASVGGIKQLPRAQEPRDVLW